VGYTIRIDGLPDPSVCNHALWHTASVRLTHSNHAYTAINMPIARVNLTRTPDDDGLPQYKGLYKVPQSDRFNEQMYLLRPTSIILLCALVSLCFKSQLVCRSHAW
jgi:hypothetical protein